MEGSEPRDEVSAAAGRADPPDPQRRHSRWMWVSALLAIVAVGLTVWALTLRSDVDSTQQELDTTTQELASAKQELDTTKQQLTTAEQEVTDAPVLPAQAHRSRPGDRKGALRRVRRAVGGGTR